MSNLLIIYTRPDGGLSLCRSAEKEDLLEEFERMTPQDLINHAERELLLHTTGDGNNLKYYVDYHDYVLNEIEGIITVQNSEDFIRKLIWKSIPDTAINPREIDAAGVADWQFRDAWCDKTSSPGIDIDLSKAKEQKLKELRYFRDLLLNESDKIMARLQDVGTAEQITLLKSYRQTLRDATNPLNALEVSGYNDTVILSEIISLSDPKNLPQIPVFN